MGDLQFGAAEHMNETGRMRMHGLFLPRFETVFEHAHAIILQ